jgi:prepilin-type processing-associated H-X9-DG protein/prepilin-type N-terminal cleavage/methylation domain-containing protein
MKRTAGFTLVELLIVIGIIAILMGILLPSLNRARASAQLAQCQNNLRQWGIGFQMYVDQSGGALPLRVPDGTKAEYFGPSLANPIPGYPLGINDMSIYFNAVPANVGNRSYYQMLLDNKNGRDPLPGPGTNSIFLCPSAPQPGGSQNAIDVVDPKNQGFYNNLWATDSTGTLMSATTPAQFDSNFSYCYNKNLMNPPAASAADPSPPLIVSARMSHLRPASSVVMMGEKIAFPGEYLDSSVQTWNQSVGKPLAEKITSQGYAGQISTLKVNFLNFAARHNGGGNLLFADGHVEFYRWTDVQPKPSAIPGLNPPYDANQQNVIWCPWGPANK